ncbi:glycosyltransferase [Clostridium butyricum]|uniref:glycosyltransferase n=1 Tax=Clostridium butyricum TaxID=1492 RepID=UPI003D0CBE2D
MLLTIGMMVKNEEKHLKDCLESLKPLLQKLDAELVIVDTGSTDNTINIAKEYTERLYFHKWNDNFSEMRNITINYAKGDWFFVVDGDEVLQNTDEIIEFFKSGEYKKYNSGSMILKNFVNSKELDKYGLCHTIRLFKNDGSFKYTGSVHNQPTYNEPTKKVLCTIEHYGYLSDDIELMEKKFIRTSNILKKELEKDPENIYYRYQLSVSYYMHSDFSESLEEISRAYNKLNEQNKKNYKYILNEYANILISNKRIKECEELCTKELKLTNNEEMYKIDLLYFLAKCQCYQGDYDNSLINYEKYLKLLDKLEEGILPLDLSIKVITSSDRYLAYNDMAISEYSNKNYKSVIKNILKIENEERFTALLNILINSFIKLDDFEGLKNIYENKILDLSENSIKRFELELENIMIKLKDDQILKKIEILFSNSNNLTSYTYLNQLRLASNNSDKEKIYNKIIENTDFNNGVSCYGDLLYIGIINNYNIAELIEKLDYDKIVEFLDYCDRKYDDFSECLLEITKKNILCKDGFTNNRLQVVICRALLVLDKIKDEDYRIIFNQYIHNGIELISGIYSKYILDNEMVFELKNDEHKFFLYMMKAEENKDISKKEYVRYLRYSLKSYPYMSKGIEFLLNSLSDVINKDNSEITKLKNMLLKNIELLLSTGRLEEAFSIVEEYEKIVGSDFYILLYKSLILKNI